MEQPALTDIHSKRCPKRHFSYKIGAKTTSVVKLYCNRCLNGRMSLITLDFKILKLILKN